MQDAKRQLETTMVVDQMNQRDTGGAPSIADDVTSDGEVRLLLPQPHSASALQGAVLCAATLGRAPRSPLPSQPQTCPN